MVVCPGDGDDWGIGQVATCPYGFYLPGGIAGGWARGGFAILQNCNLNPMNWIYFIF
jgi:hypothetical protein